MIIDKITYDCSAITVGIVHLARHPDGAAPATRIVDTVLADSNAREVAFPARE